MTKVSFLISGYGSNLIEILSQLKKEKQKIFKPFKIISNKIISGDLKKLVSNHYRDVIIYENTKNLNLVNFKKTDLIFSIGYMRKIPLTIIHKYPTINLHPSLLPLYKGLMTQKRMLINSENKFGFTIHKVNEYIDEGEILFQKKSAIESLSEYDLFKNHKELEHKYVYQALRGICKKL